MNETYETKRYPTDKIALLGLFIVALLTARFIIASRYNQPLKAGSEIIAEIKSTGLNSLLDDQGREGFFLIKDAAGRTIGFAMDVLIDSGTDAQLNIQAASLFYIRGRNAQEQATFFQSDNSFDEFTYKSEASNQTGRSGTEIALDKAGVMTVRKLGPRAEEKNYQLSSAAIPDVFLDLTFSQMLNSNYKKIVVDIIEADGKITPALISKIETEDNDEYILNVEFLDGRGISELVYLNSQRQISKRIPQQKGLYSFERTNTENILKQFPERADYILQKSKMLEQNQLRKNSE